MITQIIKLDYTDLGKKITFNLCNRSSKSVQSISGGRDSGKVTEKGSVC